MRRFGIVSLVLGAALTAVVGAAVAAPTQLSSTMSAEEEVPSPGPTGAKGSGVFQADPEAGQFCYKLTYDGPGTPSAAHIHPGAKGTTGPPAVDMKIAENGMEGCVPADGAVLQAIIADPASYYANIHTPEYKAGAVRGQLSAP